MVRDRNTFFRIEVDRVKYVKFFLTVFQINTKTKDTEHDLFLNLDKCFGNVLTLLWHLFQGFTNTHFIFWELKKVSPKKVVFDTPAHEPSLSGKAVTSTYRIGVTVVLNASIKSRLDLHIFVHFNHEDTHVYKWKNIHSHKQNLEYPHSFNKTQIVENAHSLWKYTCILAQKYTCMSYPQSQISTYFSTKHMCL